jgi:hypothetical protein
MKSYLDPVKHCRCLIFGCIFLPKIPTFTLTLEIIDILNQVRQYVIFDNDQLNLVHELERNVYK